MSIRDEIRSAGALSAIIDLRHAKERRPIRVLRPQVITIPEDAPTDVLTPPGTVQLFIGFRGTKTFVRCRRVYEAQDFSNLERLQQDIRRQGQDLALVSVMDAAKMAQSAMTIADFRYGGLTLLSDVFLPKNIDVSAAALPYNGGPIDGRSFSVVEYVKDENECEYEYFVVVRPPKLTDIEKAALSAIPADMSEVNIASAPEILAATPAVVIWFVLATLGGAVCFTDIAAALNEIHLDEKDILRLGARGSAAELVQLRREVFERLGS